MCSLYQYCYASFLVVSSAILHENCKTRWQENDWPIKNPLHMKLLFLALMENTSTSPCLLACCFAKHNRVSGALIYIMEMGIFTSMIFSFSNFMKKIFSFILSRLGLHRNFFFQWWGKFGLLNKFLILKTEIYVLNDIGLCKKNFSWNKPAMCNLFQLH